MTIKELIEHLQDLDPDRNVWVIYDTFFAYKPDFSETMDEADCLCIDNRRDLKKGDYKMEVG